MFETVKKYHREIMVGLIVICMGSILVGVVRYLITLKNSLRDNAVQNVIDATTQQQQTFDDFFASDQERLHGYAEYLAEYDHGSPEDFQQLLTLFRGIDAECLVMCLDEGWVCGSMHSDILHLGEKELSTYRDLPSSGVLDNYIGLFSGTPKFSYYETFTFNNGHKGLIQKVYERSKILETFNLSLYDGRGYGYILDQKGDILLRSVPSTSKRPYVNVFDALNDTHSPQEDIDALNTALNTQETGSIIFDGDNGRFIYTYIPLESVDNWFMLSIVPEEAISDEADEILRYTQTSLGILLVILLICTLFAILIWCTQKDIKSKEQEVEYQSQLFDIFATYLSSNTDDVYMMMDMASGQLEYTSPNMERILGLSGQEIMDGLHTFEMVSSTGETMNLESLRKLRPGTRIEPVMTERVNHETGEHKWFLEHTYCTQVQGIDKLVFYISDRTRERKTQDSLAEALRMAQAANDAKSSFLSNVSHDIRTPMNAITGFLALMRDEVNNPGKIMEYIQRIDSASQHLLGLINDVLDMNKIESGSTTLTISEMSMAEVVEEINTIIRPQAKAKNQSFDIFVSHLKYENLMGDKMRINQILINLLSNAVKYTPKDGAIQLRVEELSQVVDNYSRVRFTVSDNGLGMSEDFQKIIFEPFSREDTKVTHEIQGTGLGMPITKSLVELMGGTIRVESLPGEGSTFTVELELRIQETEDDDSEFWSEHKVAKMIVADDDEETCRSIVRVMSQAGVVTDYATDGETSVRMMREHREAGHPYDLILLDWKMPTLDGLETARLIRKNYSDKIPILLLTAYDWSDIEAEAVEIGIDHFMPKPFFMSTFKEAIRRVMGDRRKNDTDSPSDVVQNKHILVVDDVEINRLILVDILSNLGASCDVAGNGREAVEIFEKSQPGDYDLILMDVQMPVMDGCAATRAIRSSSHLSAQTVPIIAITANAFVDDVRDSIDSGMDAHIAKPIQIDKLKSTIQKVLDNRRDDGKENLQ